METKYKMASFHRFLFLKNLPENPPAFPVRILWEKHVSWLSPATLRGFVLKGYLLCPMLGLKEDTQPMSLRS